LRRATTVLTFLATGNPTGLKFMVEHAGARALFDFGREHAPGREPFSLGLEPRPGRELADLLAVGAAPRVDGVYDEWDGRTSVFISHLHLDHTALVRFLAPPVPLYYPAGMEQLRADCVRAGYATWREPPGTPVADRGVVRCGEMDVEFVAVDHDLPGATGFLIRTPDLVVAFTGDHRWHGLRPGVTAAFAEAARGCDLLLLECVSLGSEPETLPPLGEAEVARRFEELVGRARGLVLVNLYPMNRERVDAFARASESLGRRFVMEPQAAVAAGRPEVLTGIAEVAADPARYCLQLGFSALPALIDLQPPPGSIWVQSGGTPLGSFDPARPVLEAWTELFGLELVHLGSSGHSFPEDLSRMVETVSPGLVLPVHSRAPELLQAPGVPRLIPQPLRPYSAGELRTASSRRRLEGG
jgi:ribonuclease J